MLIHNVIRIIAVFISISQVLVVGCAYGDKKYDNCDNLIKEVLIAESKARTFQEYQKSWMALGQISEIADETKRIKCYMKLLNYQLGEGNLEYLEELILEEGNKSYSYLVKELKKEVDCLEEYKDICISKSRKLKILKDLINEIQSGAEIGVKEI